MLKADEGEIIIHGKKLDLMAEYTHLTNHLLKCGALSEKDIDVCVKNAKLSDDELQEKIEKIINKLLGHLCSEL